MDKQNPDVIEQPSELAVPAQKRTWVTPAFEQVALKDALNTTIVNAAFDGDTNSS